VARARTEDGEALPEADRLEGFAHPRETRLLLGQDAPERTLAAAFSSGRMHHAWLITGRQGIGKATLAYRLARHALARPEERDRSAASLEVAAHTAAARQVTALSHPGLLLLRRPCDPRSKRFATSIPVDEVRRVKSFLALTGGQDAWRAVIVDSADELNVNAANALLKSLEEPPQRALFLLICSEPSRVLATVRSRCRRLECSPLVGGELRRAVEAALTAAGLDVPTHEEWRRLEPLSQGSVRRALQLAASGGLEVQDQIEALFATLPEVDWSAAHVLADQLAFSAQEQRFEAFYELFLAHLSSLVRARAVAAAKAPLYPLAERLIRADKLPAWAALWENALSEKNEAVRLNLDRKALLLGVFGRLEALARG
jgi:DNA polymerase-3 subunit delta'